MLSADLLREARLRAGLTQRELARRAKRPQSSIARWESGTMQPSLETLRDLLRACGFDLWYRLARADDSYVAHIDQNLELSPRERVDQALRLERVYDQVRAAGRG